MDIVASMKVYVAVVDAGSFAAAADRLAMSRAMASRHVLNLEDHLGTRLLNRTTRRLSMTESGSIFYDRCLPILADIAEAEQLAGQMSAAPKGVLKITMPLAYGLHRLGPVVADYVGAFPKVKLAISMSDRKADLVEEGFDLAIRIGTLPESDLIARKLGTERSVICASPAYLKQHGVPQTPEALGKHLCLGYSLTNSGDEWRLHKLAPESVPERGSKRTASAHAARAAREPARAAASATAAASRSTAQRKPPDAPYAVRISGPVKADNGDILRLAAIAGAGLVLQPLFIVGDDLKSGRLVQVLPDYGSAELGIYAIYPSRKHLSAKVRTFVDFLVRHLDTAIDRD